MAAPYTEQKDHLDFAKLGDTGQDNTDAIAPITNGEPATQTVLRRAPENLRERTEDVRQFAEEMAYYRDVQHLSVHTAGDITWGGTVLEGGDGKITQAAAIFIKPFLTPRADTKGTLSIGVAASNQITYTVAATGWSTERMNQVFVEHRDSLGAALSGIITDGPVKRIIVVFDSTNTSHDAAAVKTAVDIAVAADTDLVGNLVTTTNAAALVPIASITETRIEGTAEAEEHRINAGVLDSLTTTTPLQSGDTIAIWYRYLVDPTGGFDGRRESTSTHGNVNIPISALFITSLEPSKIPGAIPLCTVTGNTSNPSGRLVFIDGSVYRKDQTFQLGGAGAGDIYYNGGPNWADLTPNPATDLNTQLDKIITDLGTGIGGTAKISGAAITASVPGNDAIPADKLSDQLQLLLDLINNRADLTDTVLQSFAGPLDVNAASVLDPKLGSAQYDTKYSQIWESVVKTPAPRMLRMYTAGTTASTGRGLFITVNARWTTVWTADDVGFSAYGVHIGDAGIVQLTKQTTTVAWADADWLLATDDTGAYLNAGRFISKTANPESPIIKSADDLGVVPHLGEYKLVFENLNSVPTFGLTRIYIQDSGLIQKFVITHNAKWVAATNLWQADNNAVRAGKYAFSLTGGGPRSYIGIESRGVTGVDWADTSWDSTFSTGLATSTLDGVGQLVYSPGFTRTREIPLTRGYFAVGSPPSAGFSSDAGITGPGVLKAQGAGVAIVLPIDLPANAFLTSVDVIMQNAPGGTISMALFVQDIDYTTFVQSNLSLGTASSAAIVPDKISIATGSSNTAGRSYHLHIYSDTGNSLVYGARYTYLSDTFAD